MIFSFLITILVLLVLNTTLSLLTIALGIQQNSVPLVSIISLLVSLIMITWNILAISSL